MRLIDADDLINEIKYHLWDWDTVNGITAQTVLKQTITDIQNQAAVDAVPRNKGAWIRNNNGTYYCSLCQSWIPNEQRYYANYCLFCGAGMRSEADETN